MIKISDSGVMINSKTKTQHSRNANQLSDIAFPKLVNGGETPTEKYFGAFIKQLQTSLDSLLKSTNAGKEVQELAFVNLYKQIFIYLDNQSENLFSTLTREQCQVFFDSTKLVSTMQNQANTLKELSKEDILNLQKITKENSDMEKSTGIDFSEVDSLML